MKKATRSLIRDYGMTIGIAILAAIGVRAFIIEAYRIPTPSMQPALEPGDTLFVAKWAYGLRWPGSLQPFTRSSLPARGEIVVYTYQTPSGDTIDSIKRVVGLPGDRVALRQGVAWLNGQALGQAQSKSVCGSELIPGGRSYGVCRVPPLLADRPEETVPDGHVYVLPDYRSQSAIDSRMTGPHLVPTFALRGRPLWIWMSVEPREGFFPQIRFGRIFKRVE